MEGALAQFIERLFQPVALGLLTIIAVLMFVPNGFQFEAPGADATPDTHNAWPSGLSEPTVWLTAGAMLCFIVGQIVSVIGQFLFARLFDNASEEKSVGRFFYLVRCVAGEDEFVRDRYDQVRFQVDLLCGGIGASAISILSAVFLALNNWDHFLTVWIFGLGAVVMFVASMVSALFHANQFWRQLDRIVKDQDAKKSTPATEEVRQ